MTKARNISDLLDATGDIKSTALDNVPPSDNASSLTTGTLPVARLADGSITNAKLDNDAKVVKSASAPSSPSEGDLWYDTGNEVLKVYQQTFSGFVKVSAEVAVLSSITGTIYNGLASNLTLNGTGFLTSNLVVSFTPSGGSASTVTVTPTNDTTAAVAVPSAIYNLSASTVISIQVTNADNSTSSSIDKTINALPSGGTTSSSGGDRIHTFTSSGTFTVPSGLTLSNVEYLVLAGGAGGGAEHGTNGAGAGGGGGLRSSRTGSNSGGGASAESKQTISAGSYTVTVGAGGAGVTSGGAANGTPGSNSVFNGITSNGGGYGSGDASLSTNNGGSGGCGGGGNSSGNGAGGSGTSGQGYAGGAGNNSSSHGGGGGGGAGSAGTNAGSGARGSSHGGDGGNGVSNDISGSSVIYSGGGGGASWNSNPGGYGGGAGGAGGSQSTVGGNGTVNRGGGGGAGKDTNSYPGSGSGSSGIVIIRYSLQEKFMAHFAKVKDGIVTKVIVAEQEFIDNLVDTEPGEWIQTSYNTKGGVHLLGGTPLRKNYAGIGFTYDKDKDAFIPPKPFDSWSLNETTCLWECPVAYPTDGQKYIWNEETTSWDIEE